MLNFTTYTQSLTLFSFRYYVFLFRWDTELFLKYNHKPSLRVLLNEKPFEMFSDVDVDGLISYGETFNFVKKQMTEAKGNTITTLRNRLDYLEESRYLNETKRKYQEMDTNQDGFIQPAEFDDILS